MTVPGRIYRGQTAVERRTDQRQRLIRAAINRIGGQGFANTSVEDIVREARTSRSVFYQFFANRDECLVATYREAVSSLSRSVVEALADAGDDHDLVEVAVRATVHRLLADAAFARIVLIEASHGVPGLAEARREMRLALAAVIRAAWHEVEPDAAASPEAEAVCVGFVGALAESTVHLVETGRLHEAPGHIDAMVGLLRRAFVPRSPSAGASERL